MASNESNGQANGQATAAPQVVMIPVGGKPSDLYLPVAVMVTMLANLFEREDKLFTVLLGEAMTGVRLARTLHRAGPAELAERTAAAGG